MKKGLTVVLQIIVVLIGIGALALLLWEPHLEGVNAQATSLYEIYFDDPFLVLVYAGSIPFFIAVYQAFKLLGYVGKNKVFSLVAVRALQIIKYCAVIIIGFVVAEEVWIMLAHGEDDPAGAVFVGLLIIFGSIVIATAAAMFQQILQSAVELKHENDLTV